LVHVSPEQQSVDSAQASPDEMQEVWQAFEADDAPPQYGA
jgi:hypothetical protein